jgi:Ca2+-binding RTX toxin-like protein
VLAALSAAALLLAPGASASPTTCALDPLTHVLLVTVAQGKTDGGDASIARSGDGIVVSELPSRSAVACAGAPTVTNTERIEIVTKGATGVIVDLGGGALAPGITPEADGSAEIEVVRVAGGTIGVQGGSAADHFQYLSSDGLSGLSVNGDQDVDVGASGTIQNLLPVVALGGPGPDTIEAVTPLAAVVAMDGAGGNDTLRATGTRGAILAGGTGRDRLIGSRAGDVLDPGQGADRVEGLGGVDVVALSTDRQRDTVNCGGGKDLVAALPERIDRLRSCEETFKDGNRR